MEFSSDLGYGNSNVIFETSLGADEATDGCLIDLLNSKLMSAY